MACTGGEGGGGVTHHMTRYRKALSCSCRYVMACTGGEGGGGGLLTT